MSQVVVTTEKPIVQIQGSGEAVTVLTEEKQEVILNAGTVVQGSGGAITKVDGGHF